MEPIEHRNDGYVGQLSGFEQTYAAEAKAFAFHDTLDPDVRFLRDRRLKWAIGEYEQHCAKPIHEQSALVICGGVGGEASLLLNLGFGNVTNSDFSSHACEHAARRDPRLSVLRLDAEDARGLSDGAFDLVVVQDGLHHLSRPVQALHEMLRVAAIGVVVAEPHVGFVGRFVGQEWERVGDSSCFVFRWNRTLFEQVAKSHLGRAPSELRTRRLWDHGKMAARLTEWLPTPTARRRGAQVLYGALRPMSRLGNNFVGVIVK